MRTTTHVGNGSASHNDRAFLKQEKNKDKGKHIDRDRTAENLYWCTGENKLSHTARDFRQAELAYYRKQFSEHLKVQNALYRSRRQTSRCKSIEQIYASARYRPHEMILQIGDSKDSRDPKEAVLELYRNFNHRFKKNAKILSIAIHYDETVPHAHVRYVVFAHDRDGHAYPAMDKGLQEAGIEKACKQAELADNARYNNREIGLQNWIRSTWLRILDRLNITVDKEPDPANVGKKSRELTKYLEKKNAGLERQIEALEDTKQDLADNVTRLDKQKTYLEDRIDDVGWQMSNKIQIQDMLQRHEADRKAKKRGQTIDDDDDDMIL